MKKKLLSIGAVLAACVLVGQGAQAKTLEDVLKEKGVITEADYKEVTKNKQIDYKLGKGFTFTSADEKFQLTLGGRMLVRYMFLDKDLNNGLSSAGKTVTGVSDTSTFSLPKGQIWLMGYAYFKDLTYRLQMDLAQSGNSKMLEYAYLKYRFFDELQLLAGQTKLSYGRQYLAASGNLEFVDTSAATKAFQTSYDLGAYLSGNILGGIINYDVSYSNGVGQTTARGTNDGAVLAHVAYNPFGAFAYSEGDPEYTQKPLFTVGGTYFYDTLSETGGVLESNNMGFAQTTGWLGQNTGYFATKITDKIRIDQLNFDMAFKWMGIFAQGEYFWGQGTGKLSDAYVHAQGFYTQAGYCIIPKKLEVAMRYSYTDPNIAVTNNNQTEVMGAISYYFNNHNLKLQADIGNIHTQGAQTDPITKLKKATDDMQYRVQAAIVF